MSDYSDKMTVFPHLRSIVLIILLMLLSSLCLAGKKGGKGGKGGGGGGGGTGNGTVVSGGGGKQNTPKQKTYNKKTTTPRPMNRPKGCFVQQRVVWVPIPKYKYVDVPMAEPVYKDKKKGKSIKSMTEVPITRYTRTGSYGDSY